MERSQNVFGLVKQLVLVRWRQLSPRGRMAAVVATMALAGAGAMGAHAMSGHACCSGGCAAHRAALEASQGEPTPPCHAD